MPRSVCLDGVHLDLDVDAIEVDIGTPGCPACSDESPRWATCGCGERMHPVKRLTDGTVIYFHCAAEGEPPQAGYHVDSPGQHEWALQLTERADGYPARIATIHLQVVSLPNR